MIILMLVLWLILVVLAFTIILTSHILPLLIFIGVSALMLYLMLTNE